MTDALNTIIVGGTSTEVLALAAREVMRSGDEVASRGGDRVRELLHTTLITTYPLNREILLPSRRASLVAQIAETMWVLRGRDDIAFLSNYLPRAADFSDDGIVWRGAYGPRIRSWDNGRVDQWHEALKHAQSVSRRGVITIFDPSIDHEDGKDVPCNNWLSFSNRLGKLHLNVATRSNDLIWGWSGINQFEWSALLEISAALIGVAAGQISYNITSLHVYDRHWSKAGKIAGEEELVGLQSPRFGGDWLDTIRGYSLEDKVSELDGLLEDWFVAEERIREGEDIRDTVIAGFEEPMLRSWLYVVDSWWNDRDLPEAYQGTRLDLALQLTPKRKKAEPKPVAKASAYVQWASDLHEEKSKVYGNSWRKRGEAFSIIPNIARKVDRLGKAGAGDTELDTVTDLLIYLVKYWHWLIGNNTDDGGAIIVEHWLKTTERVTSLDYTVEGVSDLFDTLLAKIQKGPSEDRRPLVWEMIHRVWGEGERLFHKLQNETRMWKGYEDVEA